MLLTNITINRLVACVRRALVRDAKIGHILKDLMKKITLFVQIIRLIIKLICKSFDSIVSLIIPYDKLGGSKKSKKFFGLGLFS